MIEKPTEIRIKIEGEKGIKFINTLTKIKEKQKKKHEDFIKSPQYFLIKKVLEYRDMMIKNPRLTMEDIAEYDKLFGIM